MKSITRSIVAFLCVFAITHAQASSTSLANADIKYFAGVVNQKFDSMPVTSTEAYAMAAKIKAVANAAKADGTLQAVESAFLKSQSKFVSSSPSATYMYQRMVAHGYKGTQQDVSEWTATSDATSRKALVNKIGQEGLYGFLISDVAGAFTALGSRLEASSLHSQGRFINANFHSEARLLNVMSDDCNTYIGMGLNIAFIGAAASLGGVNPLGDLLTFCGAGFALVTWYACD